MPASLKSLGQACFSSFSDKFPGGFQVGLTLAPIRVFVLFSLGFSRIIEPNGSLGHPSAQRGINSLLARVDFVADLGLWFFNLGGGPRPPAHLD